MLGKLWFSSCFLLLATGFHLERRGYRDLVVKVVEMMMMMMMMMIVMMMMDDDNALCICIEMSSIF